MITFRVSAEVSNDRRVTLTVPPEVPAGKNDFVVSVATQSDDRAKRPRSSVFRQRDNSAVV